MTDLAHQPELRNEGIIRAYLEELARLKTPVQLWLPVPGAPPFATSLEQVGRDTFSTTTTPLLEPGQVLNLAFMLDAQRFISQTLAVSTGVFRLPASVRHGERRAHPRGPFGRGDRAEVWAVELCSGTFLGGRTLQGRLLDLSVAGARFALEEFDVLTGQVEALVPGDVFEAVRLSGLPHMPPLQCRGRLVHLTGLAGGLLLEGMDENDRRNLERILAPRFPPSFGLGFPDRKRRTDPADRPGTPTPKRVLARPAEVVERTLEPPSADPGPPARPPVPAALKLRKASRRILLLSAQGSTQALAGALREDGFRHVHEARSFVEAQALASGARLDLVVLDNTMGGLWAKDMMKALRAHRLLLEVPVILLVDCRNDFAWAVAEALGACYIHERREPYEDLQAVLGRWLRLGEA